MWEKLKSFLVADAVFYAALLILVGVASFGLGRTSVMNESALIRGTKTVSELPPLTSVKKSTAREVRVIASRSGSKYHLPTCPGAGQIKPENRVEFASIEAAAAAGYTPAANCPGLQ